MFNKGRGGKPRGIGFSGFTVQSKKTEGIVPTTVFGGFEKNGSDLPSATSAPRPSRFQMTFVKSSQEHKTVTTSGNKSSANLAQHPPPLPSCPPPPSDFAPPPPPPEPFPSCPPQPKEPEPSELYTPEEPLAAEIYTPDMPTMDDPEIFVPTTQVPYSISTAIYPMPKPVATTPAQQFNPQRPIYQTATNSGATQRTEADKPKEKKRKRKTRWDTPVDTPAVKPVKEFDDPELKGIAEVDDDCPYQRSADSPPPIKQVKDSSDEEEEDELDKFMAGIEEELEHQEGTGNAESESVKKAKRADIDDEDDQESYFNAVKDAPMTAYPDEEEELEYDSDGNPIPPERPKIIEPLPPIDHSEILYEAFESNFFEEHEDISKLKRTEVEDLQKKLAVKVMGADPARPCISFAHFGFDDHLMSAIRKSEYSQPTPIQSQAIPIALSGRDIIGIAKTGSGKTAAFVWPMLVHIMAQRELKEGEGPIGLIIAPTRELCQQIYAEAKRFGKCYNLRAAAVFGGGSKWEQSKALQKGVEIVVATPGRLIDHVKAKATNLERVTYLVFDEADRLFDMGFEPQVRSIANHVRPDRQCLLFSATMKKKVERLCRDILTDPLRIVVGEIGEANEDVLQVVEFFSHGTQKWPWLTSHIVEFCSGGSVLIFVTKKTNSEDLAKRMSENGYEIGLIHGDFDQFERNKVLNGFRRGEFPILIATDVAARGLDIPSIKTVINYDVARDITTHTHRVGRTGRAGERGVAYTLVSPQDVSISGDLVRNLEGANQKVPDQLMDLAMKNPWFRNSRAKRVQKGSGKREFRPRDRASRPGFGLDVQQAPTPADTNLLDDDEDLNEDGFGSGRKPTRSLFTSYAMSSSTNTGRLANLKAAFSTGYNRFTKASSSASSTMDVGSQAHDHDSRPPTLLTSFKSPDSSKGKKKGRFDR